MTTTPNPQQMQEPLRTGIPADVDAPDRIAWGLTARQLAILAVAGTTGSGLHQALSPLVPPLVLAVVALPVAGLVIAVVLGRRDGLSLDAWLLAAARYGRTPATKPPPHPLGQGLPVGWCTWPVRRRRRRRRCGCPPTRSLRKEHSHCPDTMSGQR